MGQVEWAYDLAKDLLETTLPRRWAHTRGVADQAVTLAPILGADTDTLIAACLLHDIGYAPDLVDTGMHQLDGARYLRDVSQADERLCRLVAYHSCADNEARQRNLLDALTSEFEQEKPDLARALTYCDMTTSPDGRHLDVRDRLAEIHSRYGPEHVVSRSITDATPCIVSSVRAVQAELVAHAVSGQTVQRQQGQPVRPRLPTSPREIFVTRRYVAGWGSTSRYLRLMGGFMHQMSDRHVVRFGRSLARDARRISDKDLERLLESEWRSRLTAAWLIGLDRRTHFRDQLRTRLLDSEFVYAGEGYCFAFARFGQDEDATILADYLDRYLPQTDCDYDQTRAIGALLHLDEQRGTGKAARFLVPGGLWDQSAMRDKDPAKEKQYMDELCAFAESCMVGRIKEWLPRRRHFVDRYWD